VQTPALYVMAPAPALGAALAQRALAAPHAASVAVAAVVEDVSRETWPSDVAPMGGVMAAYVGAQRQLGAAQRGLIEAQRGAYLETLAAQRRGVERLVLMARQGGATAPPPQETARDAGARPMGPRGELDRAQLEYLSWGQVSRVFGPLFAAQDAHRVQTRMPMPPLLLCDRVLRIDAEPASMKTGTIVTETDVTADAWYIHEGYMSPGIMIESGQADLLLVSYLGIDLQHGGERAYRLLGCELTYYGHAPKVGETLHYEITIDGWAKHGEVILFFFHYDCTVNGELRLQVRGGQAGFFTVEELAESGGVLWSPEEHSPDPARRVDAPQQLTTRRAFDRAALDAFATGHPELCFGEGFERAQAQVKPPRIPHGNRLLLDRVLVLDVAGGPWGSGYLLAEADVSPDDWFFEGHFYNDPCMPGTLMFDVCTQAMAFYMAALGLTLDRDGWRFEPMPGAQYMMRCRGQVTPTARLVTYELFVEEVWVGSEPVLWADLLVTVDGLKAFHCRRMGLRLVPGDVLEALVALPAPDQPFSARPAPGSFAASRAVSPLHNGPSSPIASYEADPTYASIVALALGKHSQAFGPAFGVFDGARRAAHMPGPPYLFMTRVVGVDQPCDQFNAGVTAQIGYKIPESAWYFEENTARVMPYGVFMEVALQPCGWLSTWIGSMMRSERDMSYRNLDGKATLYHIPKPNEGELLTTTKLIKNAMSGGMILQTFEVSVALNGAPIYVLETVFGFFPPEALAQQVGLPVTDEERAWLTAPCEGFGVVELGRSGQLKMVNRVTGAWPAGGRFGQGKWRAVIDVSPSDWFFKAHFFRDPVQPGSLGVEALLQLLQWVAAQRLGLGSGAHFESVALGVEHVWRYRGQVTPDHREVVLELDLERVEREAAGTVLVVAQGWLWVGEKRIYEVQGLAVRVSGRFHVQ
jgi:3-hydroxymyristoyl/3-hydroxydecanoyl-(acyl carrier protein) dehydratase